MIKEEKALKLVQWNMTMMISKRYEVLYDQLWSLRDNLLWFVPQI